MEPQFFLVKVELISKLPAEKHLIRISKEIMKLELAQV
jgi:hypothetical protein